VVEIIDELWAALCLIFIASMLFTLVGPEPELTLLKQNQMCHEFVATMTWMWLMQLVQWVVVISQSTADGHTLDRHSRFVASEPTIKAPWYNPGRESYLPHLSYLELP